MNGFRANLYLDMNLVPQSMYRTCSYLNMANCHTVYLDTHRDLLF